MGKDWSRDHSERDRFLKEEFEKFRAGLPDIKPLTDQELNVELARLNVVFDACRSAEVARPNQAITREVMTRIHAIRDELEARGRAEDRARANASLDEDRRSNRIALLALVVAVLSFALSAWALWVVKT